MRGLLATLLAPALLCMLAGFTTPPPDVMELTPPSDRAEAFAVIVPPPLPSIVAAGEWDYAAPEVTVIAPPPPRRAYVPRDYGPVPELTGPILLDAAQYIGVPYVWGGESMSGMDCSGFVQRVYADLGYSLPRTTDGIYRAGTVTTNPQPGDVMYWTAGHVALYVAPGWRLDANRPGSTIQIRPSFGTPVYLHID